jgi:cytoskeletal protein RodZ
LGAFGNKFRKEREKKHFSLDDVSHVTKISSRMLQAIEDEHFDQLPGGVFNKGFIRAYAKHLGLNDEDAITDYLACLRQAQVDAQAAWEPARAASSRSATAEKRAPVKKPLVKTTPVPAQVEELPELQLPRAEHVRPPRKNFAGKSEREIPWRGFLAGLLIVLALYLWLRHSRVAHHDTASASSSSVASPTPLPSLPATQLPATPPPAAAPAKKTAKEAEESDVTIRTFPAADDAKPLAKPAAPMTLLIRASENSWISAAADGQPATEETLIAPAHISIRATRDIVLKVGNAAAVTLTWNGQEIPAQGAEGEVKTYTFDANGQRPDPATNH